MHFVCSDVTSAFSETCDRVICNEKQFRLLCVYVEAFQEIFDKVVKNLDDRQLDEISVNFSRLKY